jgi:transposase
MKKEDFRTISEDARFIIRKKAIRLINSGIKKIVVAQSLEVRPTTISSWVKLYKEGGYQALKSQKCGVKEGSNASLTSDQQKEIQLKIIDKMPDQLKLNFALWTRKAVAELTNKSPKL